MKRTHILTLVATLLLALLGFALFRMASQQGSHSGSPAYPLPTAARTFNPPPPPMTPSVFTSPPALPAYTPQGTPLPLPQLQSTFTPAPRLPSPTWTAIPADITSWTSFTGKSGFSFSYPSNWKVSEDYIVNSSVKPVSIQINNLRGTYPRNTTVIPGGVIIQLINNESPVPPMGAAFIVGDQRLPGLQFIKGREATAQDTHFDVLEQSIIVYFAAGQRQWIITGSFYPPKEGLIQNTTIFYQIVGSLHHETK